MTDQSAVRHIVPVETASAAAEMRPDGDINLAVI
jgi:hypothetical protein